MIGTNGKIFEYTNYLFEFFNAYTHMGNFSWPGCPGAVTLDPLRSLQGRLASLSVIARTATFLSPGRQVDEVCRHQISKLSMSTICRYMTNWNSLHIAKAHTCISRRPIMRIPLSIILAGALVGARSQPQKCQAARTSCTSMCSSARAKPEVDSGENIDNPGFVNVTDEGI